MNLNEKAARAWRDLEFAADAVGVLAVANISLPIEVARALVDERRERSALTPPDVAGLVERLLTEDRVNLSDKVAVKRLLERIAQDACEAALVLTHLAAENALLREALTEIGEGRPPNPVGGPWSFYDDLIAFARRARTAGGHP